MQRTAVTHGDSPLLIVAGAGTGKTATIAARLAHLLDRGVAPPRILLLTFSRRAAREMIERARTMTAAGDARAVPGGTFHAIGSRFLRRQGRRIGVAPSFTVLDESDAVELLGLVRHDLGMGSGRRRSPRAATLLDMYTRMVNTQRKLADVLRDDHPAYQGDAEAIAGVFRGYTERKRAQQTFDYDDLLLYWRVLAQQTPAGQRPYDFVLVDEYQDVNRAQADIVAALCPDGTGLTVVGDDAQAIYGFRGCDVRNMIEFPDRYPGTTIVRLEENYRSTPPILAVANAVMARAAEGHRKELWSSRAGAHRPVLRCCEDGPSQAEAVCDSILGHRERGVPLTRQAVLFRASHHSDELELALARRGIPFKKFGGLKFLEAAHVKDLLALLRLLDNPWDEIAWSRALRLLDGVGPATAGRIVDALGVRRDQPPPTPVPASPADSPLARFVAGAGGVPGTDDVKAMQAVLDQCCDRPAHPTPSAAAQVALLARFLAPLIERRYDAAPARLADLAQLEQTATRFASRRQLLNELTLDPPTSTSDLAGEPLLDDEYVTLSTVHSAKGGEWDVVHVISAADGLFPSDMALKDADGLEEERRLFYVAVTRARDRLEVNSTVRYYFRPRGLDDAHGYGQLSRFLDDSVVALMDRELAGPGWSIGDDFAGDPSPGTGIGEASVDGFLSDLLA